MNAWQTNPPNMIKKRMLILSEVLVAFLVGGGPVLLMMYLSGVEGIVVAIKAPFTRGPILYFYAALTFAYIVIQWVNLFVFSHHRISKRIVLTMVYCFQQSGVSLLGV